MKASQKLLIGVSGLCCSIRGLVSVLLLRARAEGRLNRLRDQRRTITKVAALFSRAHRSVPSPVLIDSRSSDRNLYSLHGIDPRSF